MPFFDTSIPADTEGVKLGAQRIRDIKTALNPLIAQVWDNSGVFLTKWVTSAMLQYDALLDSLRAVTDQHLKSASVTLRSLVPALFPASGLGRSFFGHQIFGTTKLGADITLTSTGTPTQPAVGSPMTISVTTDPVAAGILSPGPKNFTFVSVGSAVQPVLNNTVVITVTTDPIAAGLVPGYRVQMIDGSTYNEYLVTAVLSSPMQVTLKLVVLNGPSVNPNTIADGTSFYTSSRLVTIPDGTGTVDTYVVSDAVGTPTNSVTLNLVSVGGTRSPGSTIPTAQTLTSLGAVLSSDAAGRARMGAKFLTLDKIGDAIFTADTAGRLPFASGFFDAAFAAGSYIALLPKYYGRIVTGTPSVPVSASNVTSGITVTALNNNFGGNYWIGYRLTWATPFADTTYRVSLTPETTPYGDGSGNYHADPATVLQAPVTIQVTRKTTTYIDVAYFTSAGLVTSGSSTGPNQQWSAANSQASLAAFSIAVS